MDSHKEKYHKIKEKKEKVAEIFIDVDDIGPGGVTTNLTMEYTLLSVLKESIIKKREKFRIKLKDWSDSIWTIFTEKLRVFFVSKNEKLFHFIISYKQTSLSLGKSVINIEVTENKKYSQKLQLKTGISIAHTKTVCETMCNYFNKKFIESVLNEICGNVKFIVSWNKDIDRGNSDAHLLIMFVLDQDCTIKDIIL
jgi:hypothetical protein